MIAIVAVESLEDQPVAMSLMMLLKARCSIAQGYSLCLIAMSLELQLYRCDLQPHIPSTHNYIAVNIQPGD